MIHSDLHELERALADNARATELSNKLHDDSVALKVLIPLVLARVKQPDKRAAFRVKAGQVRPLVQIAVVTGKSEVSSVVASAMLTSDDMLDVICEERLRVLPQVAVFAAMTSALADKLPERLVHQAA
jgi:hypothetical protein